VAAAIAMAILLVLDGAPAARAAELELPVPRVCSTPAT